MRCGVAQQPVPRGTTRHARSRSCGGPRLALPGRGGIHSMQKLSSLVLLGSSLLVCACTNGGRDDGDSVASAIDSSESTESEGNVMMGSIDGADSAGLLAPTGADIAVRIAANVSLRWNPSGCATVSQHDALVSIMFNDCTGPRGLLHVTGTLDLAISVSTTGAITVHGTSPSLQVNRADLVIDATATYTTSGTGHSLVVETSGAGTGPRGNPVD